MAGVYYYPLLNTVATAARDKLSEFDPGSLTNLIKCFSRLGYTVRGLGAFASGTGLHGELQCRR